LISHNSIKEVFDVAKEWGWPNPSAMLEQTAREEVAAMIGHHRLCRVMEAIMLEDSRPKERSKGKH